MLAQVIRFRSVGGLSIVDDFYEHHCYWLCSCIFLTLAILVYPVSVCDFEWNGCILKVVILISCNCVDLCYVIVRGMIWNISEVIVEVLIGRLCFGQSISCSMCNVKSMWPIWCSFFWEVLFWIFLDIGFLIYMYAVQLVGLL